MTLYRCLVGWLLCMRYLSYPKALSLLSAIRHSDSVSKPEE